MLMQIASRTASRLSKTRAGTSFAAKMFTTTTSDINIATASRMSREKLAESMIESGSLPANTAVIDVRDDDHVGGHIKGSLNVPSSQLDYRMPELVRKLKDKEKVVFHCALSQVRGPKAAMNYLKERRRLLKDETDGSSEVSKDQADEVKTDGEKKAQEVFVLDGGFVKWQEKYGMALSTLLSILALTQLQIRQRCHIDRCICRRYLGRRRELLSQAKRTH